MHVVLECRAGSFKLSLQGTFVSSAPDGCCCLGCCLFRSQGGPTEDDLPGDVAACLDGWVEGPTWAAPLNNRQLAALLLMMSAARE